MIIDPRTPVIVGVGQVNSLPSSDGDGEPIDLLLGRPEPTELMARAVAAAGADASGTAVAGEEGAPLSGAGQHLLSRVGSIRVVNPLSWNYANPAWLVAHRLGLDPGQLVRTTTGGNNPQRLVNRTALEIARGRYDVVVVAGADCFHTTTAARRHPDRPVLPWTVQGAETPVPVPFGNDRRGTTDAEERGGLDLPIHVFPLFENALRAEAGRDLDEHRQRLGELWARFASVAADNPSAWLRHPPTAQDIAEEGPSNRMIAYPYTKLLTANMQVDQGAALILCSVDAARSAGVPRERWVFPLAGSDADDHWYLSHRANFHSSPAIRLAGASAMAAAGICPDEAAYVDLYSCFPSVVEIAATELGLPLDRPDRPLTVTGGLTFAGGPGSNYGTHAVATMVGRLRDDPGAKGLVTGLGWYATEHSVGIYGTEPGSTGTTVASRAVDRIPPGSAIEEAAGFWWVDPQAAVSSLPQCAPDADAEGEVTVETYSVAHDPDGSPERAVVACRTSDGRRSWASVVDPDQLALLVTEEGCGRLGRLRAGVVDLR